LVERKVLTVLDRDALAVYCQAYADFLAAEKEVRRLGQVIKTAGGNYIQNPAVAIQNKAAGLMDRFGGKFGLSPADRAGIPSPDPQPSDVGKGRFFR